jgi:hypothetical protein
LGIPARLAVGFAQGERQIPPLDEGIPPGVGGSIFREQLSETSTYIVRQKDAHAWPEVYFPDFGWVIFEPTVSQPPLFRPSGESFTTPEQDQSDANQNNPETQGELNPPDQQRPDENETDINPGTLFWTFANIIKLVILLLSIGLLALVSWQVKRGFKVTPFLERISVEVPERVEKSLRRMGIRPPDFLITWINFRKLPPLSRSYMEINFALKRVRRKPAIQDTPAERAYSLIQAIPETSSPANQLLAEYQTSIYSPDQADLEVAQKAGIEIRKLSWLARLGKVLERFQEPDRNR